MAGLGGFVPSSLPEKVSAPDVEGARPHVPMRRHEAFGGDSIPENDLLHYLVEGKTMLGCDGHLLEMLAPLRFDSMPEPKHVYPVHVPIDCLVIRETSMMVGKTMFHGKSGYLNKVPVLSNQYLPVPENTLPMPYVQTAEQRAVIVEEMDVIAEKICALQAELEDSRLVSNPKHIELLTLQMEYAYKSDAVFTSTLPMNPTILATALELKTRMTPVLRSIRMTNLEEPDTRGPGEVIGRKAPFSMLCVSADLLLLPYIRAFRQDNNTDKTVQWKAHLSLLQPKELLKTIAKHYDRNLSEMFPTVVSLNLDKEKTAHMAYDGKNNDQVRVISLGLIPIVLACFESRMQRLNPLGYMGQWLVQYFEQLIPSQYPEEEHMEMLLQLKHNVEWASRFTRFVAATDTYVWSSMRITHTMNSRWFQMVNQHYTRGLELALNDETKCNTIMQIVQAAINSQGYRPMTELDFLEANGLYPMIQMGVPSVPSVPSEPSSTASSQATRTPTSESSSKESTEATIAAPVSKATPPVNRRPSGPIAIPPPTIPIDLARRMAAGTWPKDSQKSDKKRGRPVNKDSKRQKKKARLEEVKNRLEASSSSNYVPGLDHQSLSSTEFPAMRSVVSLPAPWSPVEGTQSNNNNPFRALDAENTRMDDAF